MESRSSTASGELATRLGALLMALVAGKHQRLRQTIASAARRARPHHDLELTMHWDARANPASNRRVE